MIAAVLLGGVSIFGGRGALHGVIAGVLLIGVIYSALRLENSRSTSSTSSSALLLVLSVIPPVFLAWVCATRRPRRRTRPAARRPREAAAGISTGERQQHEVPQSTECAVGRRSPSRPALRLSACNSKNDSASDGGSSRRRRWRQAHRTSSCRRTSATPTSTPATPAGKKAVEEFGGTYAEVGPDTGYARRPGAVHQHRGPAGHRARWSSRPTTRRRSATRSTRRRTPAPRSSPSTPTPTRSCRDLFINQATADGHRQGRGRHDRRADR